MWKSDGHTTRYISNGEWIEKDKIAYPTLDIAIEKARKMNMYPKTIHKVVAYRCAICGQYHVGRSKSELTDKDREKYKKAEYKLKML